MMRLFFLLVISAFLGLVVAAQQTQPTPPPPPPSSTPAPTPKPPPSQIQTNRSVFRSAEESPFSLNPVSESDTLALRVGLLQQYVVPLYRKPTGKELALLSPSVTLLQKYSSFLKEQGTGIFRLVLDAGCANNDRVVSAKEDCLKYSMPGAGNSISFRTESYRIRRLADLTFDGNSFRITGAFMHGMLANIGDIPIEKVTLTTPGIKYATDFHPSSTFEDVVAIDESFAKGVEEGGFRYAKILAVKENSTYILRNVAYRGRLVRSTNGVAYNELDYDKRKDVTIAFRVVEKGIDGSVTIVWKQLAEAESPRIKVPQNKSPTTDDPYREEKE